MKKASLIVVFLAVLSASCIKQTVEPTPQKTAQEVVQTNTPTPPLLTQTPNPTKTITPTDIPEVVSTPIMES